MKKLLSAALAVAIVVSMSTVAFAKTCYVLSTNGLVTVDTDVLDGGGYFMPGVTYTMKLEDGNAPVDQEFVDSFRMSLKVVEGKRYVETCKLVQKNGEYYLEFRAKNNTSKYLGETNDVEIEITCVEKGKSSDFKVESQRQVDNYNENYDIEDNKTVEMGDVVYTKYITSETFTISYPDEVYISDDDYTVDNDNPVVIASEGTSKSTLHFGSAAEYDARFGDREKTLNLGFSTAEIGWIAKSNPDAQMTFIVFNGAPTFVSNSDLRVYGDNVKYLYEIHGDSLTLLDAQQHNGYMRYRTQSLSAYVDRKSVV